MAKAVFSSAAFNTLAGVAVAPSASVEVRREDTGALATIYSSDAGAALTNPFNADVLGRFEFFADGLDRGYQVAVTQGGQTHTLNHIAIGNAAQRDVSSFIGGSLFPAVDAPGARAVLGVYSQAQVDAAVAAALFSALRKNVIINGDPIVWQRGTSFASIANGTFSADRWEYVKAGAMVHDVSQSSDVPTVAQAGRLFSHSILVDCTTADAAMAAADVCYLRQKIEGYNWLPIAQRAFVISFWVKATKPGIYCVAVANGGNDRSYIGEYTVNAADTWEKKTVTVTASPSAGTWDYTNGIGLQVFVVLACGTDLQNTGGQWNSTIDIATANQVNACDNVANNFRMCGVQLEPGSVATDFEARTWHQEYALCRRYYQRIGWDDTEDIAMSGFNSGTTSALGVFHYPVPMRANPTWSFSGGADYVVQTNAGNTATNSITGALNIGRTAATVAMGTAGGLTSGQGCVIRAGNANARFTLDAEI